MITLRDLEEIVYSNDKQRFCFNESKTKIRASQGHSVAVDLSLEVLVPPKCLYHGTATRFLGSILAEGLTKQSRQHVHLSRDLETASQVGSRHGRLALLKVDAQAMHLEGFEFYRSANGVWLTDHVPAQFLLRLPSDQ